MVAQRIKEQLKLHRMKVDELCEKSGVPEGTLHNILVGRVTDPKASTLMAIAKVFHVSVNYLLGEGYITEEEKDLLQHYRDCGPHGKSMMQLVGKYEAAMALTERDGKKHKIPCLVPLGHITDGIEFSSSETLEIETDNERAFFAIQIATNNNLPTYCKGDILLLEDRFPEDGERAVFTIGNYIYLRQFFERDGKYTLKPVGRAGETIRLQKMNEVDCMGVCIGIIRN